jgi:Family of unknown function (DUF6338)
MPDSALGIFAIIFLILPGFVAHRVSSFFSPPSPSEENEFDQILRSIATGIVVAAFLAAIASLSLLGLYLVDEGKFDGLRFDVLLKEGYRAYLLERPDIALAIPLLGLAGEITLGGFLGWWDPIDNLLKRLSASRGFTTTDQWYSTLEQSRLQLKDARTYVMVRMKESRDVFRGMVQGFSFRRDPTAVRELVIEDVTYIPGGDPARKMKIPGSLPGT